MSTADNEGGPVTLIRPKASVVRTLRRAGVAPEAIEELERQLPDPVDFDRCGNLLAAHGITMDRMIDLFGGSP